MKRRTWLVTALVLILLSGLIFWRARHRIRGLVMTSAEQKKQQGLLIEPGGSGRIASAKPVSVTDKDWPWWRGFQYNNHASGPAPPLTWSETENIVWKISIEGRGHSSPCILGNQIFLTTAVEEEGSQFALCFDAITGNLLWRQRVHRGKFVYQNLKNTQASSTVATDGHHLYCLFAVDDAIWLSCLKLNGDIVWQSEVGPYVSKEGFGASPLISGNAVIVAADNVNESWIAAVHRMTGEILWRTARGTGTSYASPGMISNAGERVVAMAGLDRIVGIDPRTGTEKWSLPGPDMSASTPVEGDGMLFVTSSTQSSGIFGVRLSKPPQLMWKLALKAEVPSPLYDKGLVYFSQDLGVMICCEAETGDQVWRQRLGSNITASPILAGDHLFVCLEDGRTLVLKTGRVFDRVSENRLEEGLYATPAISRGRIFLRTSKHLYAIGQSSSATDAASQPAVQGKP
jgi:outer membrane protein assembly factor BamB